jgi:hypothetical protein
MTETDTPAPAKPTPRKLTFLEHIICMWPFCLVAIGGLLGGLCGGAAWGLNTAIIKSERPAAARYALCVLTGVVAIVAYFALVAAFGALFPDYFAKRS